MGADMEMTTLKLVTIIAESVLEQRLVRDLLKLGATGYTITEARGEGSRGVRASEWAGPNLRFEVVVSPEVCTAILERLADRYFPSYAVIAWSAEVEVVRGDKYV